MTQDISSILQDVYEGISKTSEQEYFKIHEIRYLRIVSVILGLQLQKGAHILDVGVYPPHLFDVLGKMGFTVSGIASTHEKIKRTGVAIVNIEDGNFPFKPNSFDLILMSEILEHLTVNPAIYMQPLIKLLKPNGYVLITTPNGVHLKNRVKMLAGRSPSFPLEQLMQTKRNDNSIYYRHNREFTMDELTNIIESNGLSIVLKKFESVYTPFRKNRKPSLPRIIGYNLTQLIPPLRDTLFVIGKKNGNS